MKSRIEAIVLFAPSLVVFCCLLAILSDFHGA